jgi:hypothetical protein
MAGGGIVMAGSAARPGISQKAPSKARGNKTNGDFRSQESKRPAGDAGGCMVGMNGAPRARE